ncbi:MAG: hypothetical protein JO122_04315 [Acetobacteraceae bacterium]|nr:hypothetical protein [Acetobacteraceae bacterium]
MSLDVFDPNAIIGAHDRTVREASVAKPQRAHIPGFITNRPIHALTAVAALGAAAVETIVSARSVPLGELIDPDSYMRLVRIRDGLSTGVFTHIVQADSRGRGTIIYWSHLLDFVILSIWAPLHLFLKSQAALLVAGAVTGPLFAAAFAAALVWAPYPLIKPRCRWLWMAPLAGILLSPALMTYGMLGFVHHHLPLVLMSVVAVGCAGRALEGRVDAAFWCGVCAAVGIWLSPEALPYVAMPMGALGLGWCIRPASMARPLKTCATSFAGVIAAATLIDPPNGGYLSPEPDCLSVVYLALSVLICGASWLLAHAGRGVGGMWGRIALSVTASAAVAGIWLLMFPSIVHGLGGLVPASDVAAYFGAINEMQPLRLSLSDAGLLLPGILAVVAAFCLAWRSRNPLWTYVGLCGCAAVVLAQSHIRFVGYVEAGAALMLPVILEFITGSRIPSRWKAPIRISALTAFLVAPFLLMLASHDSHPGDPMAKCHASDIRPALLQANDALVLTEISDTPEILWRTRVRTVGSLYHRSIESFMLARAAWRSGPSQTVPEAVLATRASYILACDMGRPRFVGDLPETTLQDRLDRHETPPWLREVAHAGGYHLYFIEKDFPG